MVYNRTMEMIKLQKVLLNQLNNKYYSPKELMYGYEPGSYLSPFEYKSYLDYIESFIGDSKNSMFNLNLKSFNSKYIYFLASNELISLDTSYLNLLKEAMVEKKPLVSSVFKDVIYKSRIYSEIEGTLNVENVPTTRKRLKELLEKEVKPETLNDIIIKNMDEGIKFVYSLPEFNKDNLLKLYKILSKDCLKKEDEIKDGHFYRDDEVEIDNYPGCPTSKVEECMDSLFSFVKEKIQKGDGFSQFILPHICHYYIVYIHPYFDYNGRTARMVSLWINLLINDEIMPPLISEAINQNKNEYYKALRNSREARNDLTYFLIYIFKTAISYILSYKDLEIVDQYVKNQGNVLTETELNYVKKILVTYKGKFSYQDFIKNCQIEISKQGAFKILNKFVDLKILLVVDTPSKVKLFDINNKVIKYTKSSIII